MLQAECIGRHGQGRISNRHQSCPNPHMKNQPNNTTIYSETKTKRRHSNIAINYIPYVGQPTEYNLAIIRAEGDVTVTC